MQENQSTFIICNKIAIKLNPIRIQVNTVYKKEKSMKNQTVKIDIHFFVKTQI